MGLRLDEDSDATAVASLTSDAGTAATMPPELPRHAKIERDSKVHTFDEFYDQLQAHGDDDDESDENGHPGEDDATNDKKPLLQEIKMTRTSSKKKVKAATATATLSSSSSTMVPVMSASALSMEARAKRLRGLGYIVIAALNISLMSACIKFATRHVTSHEAVFWRTVLTFALNYGIVRANKVDLFVAHEHRKLLLFRSFIGMVCVSLSYYAMAKMVLTDAIVIIFTSPVLTFLMGAVLLGEAIDRVDFFCAMISYVGVVFVARPAMLFPQGSLTKETDSIAILAALGAAATQACAYICMRKLHAVHYMAISHYFSLFGIAFSFATLWFFGVPLRIPELWSVQLALFLSAFFSCIGMLFLTLGFQMEQAGIASVMRYFDVVFVLFLDTVFLGEHVDTYSIIGGVIILGGAIVIAVRRARAKK